MTLRIEDMEFMRVQQEYWRQVNESDGFDLEKVTVTAPPQGTVLSGLLQCDCEGEGVIRDPVPLLVTRYARLGLHRYNMSKGTNYVLHHLKKYNKSMSLVASYYVTLVACDPATPTSLVTFQVGVSEEAYGRLYVRCFIARRQGDPKEPSEPLDVGGPVDGGVLPVWPSDFSDTKQFRLLKESDLQCSDWIRLILELALCATDSWLSDSLLSKLQILKVAIEAVGEDVEPLRAKTRTFYITFKGLARARFGELGEDVERRVIIKMDEGSGCLTVIGGFGFAIGEKVEKRLLGNPRGEWRFGDPLP
ncbi:unnamed protein product [Microthlaspi erraticum]|uniref:Uncharacterized protein n=1 Tax=Microthlaspi erraticum TaxID=1685480 RepID=A0A6D2JBW4_9BRAS|nr:unnamed protein product [Microthlaspi erraticum]